MERLHDIPDSYEQIFYVAGPNGASYYRSDHVHFHHFVSQRRGRDETYHLWLQHGHAVKLFLLLDMPLFTYNNRYSLKDQPVIRTLLDTLVDYSYKMGINFEAAELMLALYGEETLFLVHPHMAFESLQSLGCFWSGYELYIDKFRERAVNRLNMGEEVNRNRKFIEYSTVFMDRFNLGLFNYPITIPIAGLPFERRSCIIDRHVTPDVLNSMLISANEYTRKIFFPWMNVFRTEFAHDPPLTPYPEGWLVVEAFQHQTVNLPYEDPEKKVLGAYMKSRKILTLTSRNMITRLPGLIQEPSNEANPRYTYACQLNGCEGVNTVTLLKNGDKLLYCPLCEWFRVIHPKADQYGFHPLPDEEIHFVSGQKYINQTPYIPNDPNRVLLNLPGKKMYVVDAPMGTGKTELMKNLISEDRPDTLLVITFREMLAQNLSQVRLQVNHYKEPGYRVNRILQKKSTIVVNSLHLLDPSIVFELVFVDECVFTMLQLQSQLITENLGAIVSAFQRILRGANKVVLMQYRIPQSIIDLYASFTNISPNREEALIKKYKIMKETILPKVFMFRKGPNGLICRLIIDYITDMDRSFSNAAIKAEARLTRPFLVLSVNVRHCELVYHLLYSIAMSKYGIEQAKRIKRIHRDTNTPFRTCFTTKPNDYAYLADVIIMTNIIQAGHSIDCHFRTQYCFLFCGVLSFRDELQFVSRLRLTGRENEYRSMFLWVEPGNQGIRLAEEKRIKLLQSKSINQFDPTMIHISSILNAERADTYNNHPRLWIDEFARSQIPVVYQNGGEFIHPIFNFEWIKETSISFLEKMQDGVSDRLMVYATGEEESYPNLENLETISDLLEAQICEMFDSKKAFLLDRIMYSPINDGLIIITNAISKLGKSITNVNNYIGPNFNLWWLLDFILYNHQLREEDAQYYLEKVRNVSHKVYRQGIIDGTKLIYDLLVHFQGLKDGQFNFTEFNYENYNSELENGSSKKIEFTRYFLQTKFQQYQTGLYYFTEKDIHHELENLRDYSEDSGDMSRSVKLKLNRILGKSRIKFYWTKPKLHLEKEEMFINIIILKVLIGRDRFLRYERLFSNADLNEILELEEALKVPKQNVEELTNIIDGSVNEEPEEDDQMEVSGSDSRPDIPAYRIRVESHDLETVNLRGIANELPDPSDILTILDTEDGESGF